MIAQKLIESDFPVAYLENSALFVLDLMDDLKVQHIPLISNKRYICMLSENFLHDLDSPEKPLANHNIPRQFRPYANERTHLLDIVKVMAQTEITTLPVLDKNENFIGVISTKSILKSIANTTSILEKGSIVVLEVSNRDYMLSQIAQIVESNDAKIIHTHVNSVIDSTLLEITLKLNRVDIAGIIQTFSRYGYNIKATFSVQDMDRDLKERYESLMKFIDV